MNAPSKIRFTHPARTTAARRTATRRSVRGIALATIGLSLLAACGSDAKPLATPTTKAPPTTVADSKPSKPTSTTTAETPVTTVAASTPTTADEGAQPTTPADTTSQNVTGGAISDIADAQSGTIQIIAQGSLRDPEQGEETGTLKGSGFFIDADGLAVTNNHVVTGAATLEVFVGGDTSTSYNAQVLGVSECNDLALIQVDSNSDVPYFAWDEDPVQAGVDVYAAGFPLGDPQFTLTKGIVSKAQAGGDLTGTSSIDHTIEHDAALQPGNSGGPLLNADGQVVAVNYAGGQRDIGAQFYAISSDLAEGVVARLMQGDFESLGVNGHAIADEATGVTGIWVSGVAAGSPASEVGLLPGDIITSMNGLPVGTDGTFKDYCDVIRTAGDKPIAIEVLRYDTQEVLRGEINGDQVLATTSVFGNDEMAADNNLPTADDYTDYVSVTDDTNTITLEVPAEWSDTDTTPVTTEDGGSYPRIEAATDLYGFESGFDAPGVQFGALPAESFSIDDVLSHFAQDQSCTDGGTFAYDDGVFTGKYQLWQDCGDAGTTYVVVATQTADATTTYLTSVQAVTSADLGAIDHILATFNTAG